MRTQTASANVVELDSDLPSLASQAAIALDNVRLRRPSDLSAVARLAEMIQAAVPPPEQTWQISYFDIGSTLAVNRAVAQIAGPTASTRVDELLPQVRAFAQRLAGLSHRRDPLSSEPSEVNDLRAFCVELSRQADAGQRTVYDRPTHPYRRFV
jgi:hypothetical protein